MYVWNQTGSFSSSEADLSNVYEWISDRREHIQSTKSKANFVDFVMNHLTGSAKSEVKLRQCRREKQEKKHLTLVGLYMDIKGYHIVRNKCLKIIWTSCIYFIFSKVCFENIKILVNNSKNTTLPIATMFCCHVLHFISVCLNV